MKKDLIFPNPKYLNPEDKIKIIHSLGHTYITPGKEYIVCDKFSNGLVLEGKPLIYWNCSSNEKTHAFTVEKKESTQEELFEELEAKIIAREEREKNEIQKS